MLENNELMDFSQMFRAKEKENVVSNANVQAVLSSSSSSGSPLPSKLQMMSEGSSEEEGRWQAQCTFLVEEVTKLRNQSQSAKRDLERSEQQITLLMNENAGATGKMLAMQSEHREAKNGWLAAKTSAEAKVNELNAVLTGKDALFRKKEQEFIRLQNTLESVNKKDGAKKAKECDVRLFHISKPMPKNLSQQVKPSASLLDIELQALRSTNKSVQEENAQIRAAAMSEVHSLTQQLTACQRRLELQQTHFTAQLQAQQEAANALLAAATKAQKSAAISTSSTTAPPRTPCTPLSPRASAAAPGSIAKKYLAGTPGAKPVDWVVAQANTEVKKLRSRAEILSRRRRKQACEGGDETEEMEEEAGSISAYRCEELEAMLAEALAVIVEQDRLIHEALVSEASSSSEIEQMARCGGGWELEDEYEEEIAGEPTKSAVAASTLGSSIEELCDFELPPASPATFALLQGMGWEKLGFVPRVEGGQVSLGVDLQNEAEEEENDK